jgi:hypothetical protein
MFHIPLELGEAKIDQTMETTRAVAEVLNQAVSQSNELAKLIGREVR